MNRQCRRPSRSVGRRQAWQVPGQGTLPVGRHPAGGRPPLADRPAVEHTRATALTLATGSCCTTARLLHRPPAGSFRHCPATAPLAGCCTAPLPACFATAGLPHHWQVAGPPHCRLVSPPPGYRTTGRLLGRPTDGLFRHRRATAPLAGCCTALLPACFATAGLPHHWSVTTGQRRHNPIAVQQPGTDQQARPPAPASENPNLEQQPGTVNNNWGP
jgi:hypothetical protein